MRNRLILFIMVALLGASACKSRKRRHAERPAVVQSSIDSAAATASDILSFTLKPWTYFSSKIDVEFSYDDKKFNPNASIRMYRDSLIWISGGLFGIEGFRMLINKDSVVVLNKLEKTYTVYSNSKFSGISDAPLTVTQIQNLILGRPVFALELYEILNRNKDRISISYLQEKFSTSHSYNGQLLVIDTTAIRDRMTPNFAEAFYTDWAVISDYNFPSSTRIEATNGEKRYKIYLKYSDTDFGTAVNFPFNIPASYEKTR